MPNLNWKVTYDRWFAIYFNIVRAGEAGILGPETMVVVNGSDYQNALARFRSLSVYAAREPRRIHEVPAPVAKYLGAIAPRQAGSQLDQQKELNK
jgi:hypothetical protein